MTQSALSRHLFVSLLPSLLLGYLVFQVEKEMELRRQVERAQALGELLATLQRDRVPQDLPRLAPLLIRQWFPGREVLLTDGEGVPLAFVVEQPDTHGDIPSRSARRGAGDRWHYRLESDSGTLTLVVLTSGSGRSAIPARLVIREPLRERRLGLWGQLARRLGLFGGLGLALGALNYRLCHPDRLAGPRAGWRSRPVDGGSWGSGRGEWRAWPSWWA